MSASIRSHTPYVPAVATNTHTVALPAGVVDGDILVFWAVFPANPSNPTVAPPAGWTEAWEIGSGGSASYTGYCAFKVASGETGPYTFTTSVVDRPGGILFAVKDAASLPAFLSTTPGVTVSSITTPSITPAQDNSLIVSLVGGDAGATLTFTPGAGFTEYADVENTNNNAAVEVATLTQGAAAAVSTTVTSSTAAGLSAGILSFAPALAAATVSFAANILGNEARAGEYLSGDFLCGVDPPRVTAALVAAPPNYIEFAATVQGAGAVAPAPSVTRGIAAAVVGAGALAAQEDPLRGFAVSIAGAGTVVSTPNVLKLVTLAASTAGQAAVTPTTLGKSVLLSAHVGGPLCGEHLCGEFICDNVGALISAKLVLNSSLAVLVEGKANVAVNLGRNLLVSVQIGGQATVTATLTRVLLWPVVCTDIDLVPSSCNDLVLVGAGSSSIDLDPSECR